MEITLLLLVVFFASVLQGATGFGFSILCMSILPFFLPFKIATLSVLILAGFFAVQIAVRFRRDILVKLMIIPILAGFVGRALGFKILMSYNDNTLKLILGLLLITFSIVFMFFNKKIEIKATPVNGIVAGLISGISGGICNISGPPLVIYYLNVIKSKEEYTATANSTYFITNIFSLMLHISSGNINYSILNIVFIGLIPVVLGQIVGVKIFRRVNKEMLNKLVYILMIIIGVFLIIT